MVGSWTAGNTSLLRALPAARKTAVLALARTRYPFNERALHVHGAGRCRWRSFIASHSRPLIFWLRVLEAGDGRGEIRALDNDLEWSGNV
ncbi:hypothetical protein ZHAS_00009683 [Anopheles sinensis]|uniref:Uncharacterized protein n=1 Tax=Anopheles sinensis TaxID=74873 RepID=A0A084VV48_ANOSI|nr:hypothetical protein ZHAS_00009683 [Anopheles sinensis]